MPTHRKLTPEQKQARMDAQQALVQKIYPKVLELVSSGVNISDATKKCGIDSSNFYKNITQLQKTELLIQKELHAKWKRQKLKYNYSKFPDLNIE